MWWYSDDTRDWFLWCGMKYEYEKYEYTSFNVCNIFILELFWPGMERRNLISHSIHGISRLEKVSGKII